MPKKIPVRKAMVYLIFFILMIKQLYSYAGMGYTLIENSTYGFQQLPGLGVSPSLWITWRWHCSSHCFWWNTPKLSGS